MLDAHDERFLIEEGTYEHFGSFSNGKNMHILLMVVHIDKYVQSTWMGHNGNFLLANSRFILHLIVFFLNLTLQYLERRNPLKMVRICDQA